MLWQDVVLSASFFERLSEIDARIALQAQERGCPICGGVLHVSRFPRRPRGGRKDSERKHRWRWSFCCANRDCRKRVTPPSMRFLGRKWYFSGVLLVVCAAIQGPEAQPIARLIELFGMSWKTVKRWRQWWSEWLPKTKFWRALRGRWVRRIDFALLPRSLLDRFIGNAEQQLVAMLRLMGPVTTVSMALEISIDICGG